MEKTKSTTESKAVKNGPTRQRYQLARGAKTQAKNLKGCSKTTGDK
jgi:hypothetical protein